MSKLINGQNSFNEKSFNEMCTELKSGEAVKVYIDCIGHTRNNMEQESYKLSLEKEFGDNLQIEKESGQYSYCYIYRLKQA